MPVGPGQQLAIRAATPLHQGMPTMLRASSIRRRRWVHIRQTPGDFAICMETSGSGWKTPRTPTITVREGSKQLSLSSAGKSLPTTATFKHRRMAQHGRMAREENPLASAYSAEAATTSVQKIAARRPAVGGNPAVGSSTSAFVLLGRSISRSLGCGKAGSETQALLSSVRVSKGEKRPDLINGLFNE